MTYEEFNRLIVEELDRVFAERPWGTMAACQRKMGVNKDYFRQWRSGSNVHMPRLLEVLALLNEEPSDFIYKALQRQEPGLIEAELEVSEQESLAIEAMKKSGVL